MKAMAYRRGQPIGEVELERVDGVYMTAQLAAAWAPMRDAAAADGIELVPTFGFRLASEQRRLYELRMDQPGDSAEVRARKAELRDRDGIAARPGWSLHQSGLALDVRTGLTSRDFRAGKRTEIYTWLETHAGRFGFAVGRVRGEPWHLELER